MMRIISIYQALLDSHNKALYLCCKAAESDDFRKHFVTLNREYQTQMEAIDALIEKIKLDLMAFEGGKITFH